MKRYWLLAVILVLISAFLIGGRVLSVTAQDEPKFLIKDEKRMSSKVLEKLDEVLKNQEVILKELADIKNAIKK